MTVWYIVGGVLVLYVAMVGIARRFNLNGDPMDRRPARAGALHPIGPEHRRRQVLAVVCHACGRAERVPAFTEETVGNWGEKILCSACKEKANGS